jgi:hypothetical protein
MLPQSPVQYVIQYNGSQGGNRYIDNSFDGGQSNMLPIGNTGALALGRCVFDSPANQSGHLP